MMINTLIRKTKASKLFYVNAYRKGLVFLIFFLITQVIWVVMIVVVEISYHDKIPDFYASSSAGILTPLKHLPTPNNSNTPLLE